MYGVNVYQSRVKMGEYLAEKIRKTIDINQFDCVIPVPDTSKPVALEISKQLKKPNFEAITKVCLGGRVLFSMLLGFPQCCAC